MHHIQILIRIHRYCYHYKQTLYYYRYIEIPNVPHHQQVARLDPSHLYRRPTMAL